MTQYVDHSYESCLNFASYFSVTCGSLLNPVDIRSTTYEALKTANKIREVKLRNIVEGDCDSYSKKSQDSNVKWVSTFDKNFPSYQDQVRNVNQSTFS